MHFEIMGVLVPEKGTAETEKRKRKAAKMGEQDKCGAD